MNTDIKIFVSHRIDLDSVTIANPLYVNVRCGAVYDQRKKVKLLGDDTGDNISIKRDNYSEFTVQYWAWKNVKADYYGLCHYRRYLSFADCFYPEWNEQRFAAEPMISKKNCRKYNILNPVLMSRQICCYDIVTSITYKVSNIPIVPHAKNVFEAFVNNPRLLVTESSIVLMKKIVEEKFPSYFNVLCDELSSPFHRGFNCFVMKKELFFSMCEFEFGVLFELEKQMVVNDRIGCYKRELGYLGEILYGAYIRFAFQSGCKVKENQIVLFFNTDKRLHFMGGVKSKAKSRIKKAFPIIERFNTTVNLINKQQKYFDKLNENIKELRHLVENIELRQRVLFFSTRHDFSNESDNKLVFWKSYPKATGLLRIIQKANAIVLEELKRVCDSLNIRFWLHGGTLIGSLRHKGFVPWDDDIDVAMLRDDYLKLKASLLTMHSCYTIKEYYYLEIGCRSCRFLRDDIDSNCFVDIFLYDRYELHYDSPVTDWKFLCEQKKVIKINSVALCDELNLYPCEPLLAEFPLLKENLDKLFNQYIKKNSSHNLNAFYLVWGIDNNYEDEKAYAWRHGRIFSRDDIFPLSSAEFEGHQYYIPKNFDAYCIAEYGIHYLDLAKNIGESIHVKEFFDTGEQVMLAKKIIAEREFIPERFAKEDVYDQ